MKLDRRDIELLRLAGRYRQIHLGVLGKLSFAGIEDEISLLSAAGLIKSSRDGKYMRLSVAGYEMLRRQGHDYGSGSDKPYTNASALRRRLEVASCALTALRAGIDVLPDNIDALSIQPSFFPAFGLRTGEANLMNAASCVGFGHWGDKGYMLQYVGTDSSGMYMANELRHFHNLSSIFSGGLNTPLAMIFAGESYIDIHKQLNIKVPSKRHGKHGFYDFWDVYRKSDMPVHLLSCDETGAMQLAIMRQPGYIAKIAGTAFGADWLPCDEEIPEADGHVRGNPLVIAVDMEARRVNKVCESARCFGRSEVMVAALKGQLDGFYKHALPRDGFIKLLSISRPVIDDAFGKGFSLHSMEGA